MQSLLTLHCDWEGERPETPATEIPSRPRDMASSVLPRYIALETNIAYDWDDYDLWAAFYYDTEKDEVLGTKYGHGSGDGISAPMDYRQALEVAPELREKIAKAVAQKLGQIADIRDAFRGSSSQFSVPCSVSPKCRKVKGSGLVLIRFFEEKSRYSYYPKSMALVYDPARNITAKIESKNVALDINGVEVARESLIRGALKSDENLWSLIHCLAYNVSYSACDHRYLAADIHSLTRSGLPEELTQKIDLANVPDPAEEAARERRFAKNRPNIVAWALAKFPEKSEEEREEIVQKTLNKYYAFA